MPFSSLEFQAMQERANRGMKNKPLSVPDKTSSAVEREIPLHNKIIAYCDSHWPPWCYIHANPAKKSTIGKGVNDFTVFLPGGKVFCAEIKTKDGKLDADQLIWRKKMEMLGHTIHVIRSLEEFIEKSNSF